MSRLTFFKCGVWFSSGKRLANIPIPGGDEQNFSIEQWRRHVLAIKNHQLNSLKGPCHIGRMKVGGRLILSRQQLKGTYHRLPHHAWPLYLGQGDYNTTIILSTATYTADQDDCLKSQAGCLHYHAVGQGETEASS